MLRCSSAWVPPSAAVVVGEPRGLNATSFDARRVRSAVPRVAPDQAAFVATLAMNGAELRRTEAGERRIALVLADCPNRDGRVGNGVGFDTPASAAAII